MAGQESAAHEVERLLAPAVKAAAGELVANLIPGGSRATAEKKEEAVNAFSALFLRSAGCITEIVEGRVNAVAVRNDALLARLAESEKKQAEDAANVAEQTPAARKSGHFRAVELARIKPLVLQGAQLSQQQQQQQPAGQDASGNADAYDAASGAYLIQGNVAMYMSSFKDWDVFCAERMAAGVPQEMIDHFMEQINMKDQPLNEENKQTVVDLIMYAAQQRRDSMRRERARGELDEIEQLANQNIDGPLNNATCTKYRAASAHLARLLAKNKKAKKIQNRSVEQVTGMKRKLDERLRGNVAH